MSSESRRIFDEISSLSTEQKNLKSINIDNQSTEEILRIINDEDKTIPLAVEKEIPYIAEAVDAVVSAIKNGGRLLYFGAGTSGRLGVVDASECPPTFGAPFGLIEGYIAGGKEAMFRAQEGAEDFEENGANDVIAAKVTEKDVVCGIAASRRTPYVMGAVKKAKQLGAKTLYVTATPRESFNIEEVDIAICPHVGPEVVMGSTRMKSGTAQKLVLNMITTTAFVRMGKTYENMMIDLQLTNKKLIERSKRIVMMITGIEYEEAARVLELSKGHVKTALVMILSKCSYEEAKERLEIADGFVRKALEL
ncbi:MAG: N-acetylmuramic acid 6-phosphate etherase [Ignavibacteriae bacterium HGW-Ignavibacteriae-2]|jgi:N-acetylmuramic acid 6-phosphate etherase|nr:N-acetylmuramic acid 6-phosphate etherase [Bacteroidota bacterium]PKL88098.1 MAG: N-acetylmuramic acid 6-phosphate etherase [Ignavibacteriae bacterium HGW-Ignavibacteriae-2]